MENIGDELKHGSIGGAIMLACANFDLGRLNVGFCRSDAGPSAPTVDTGYRSRLWTDIGARSCSRSSEADTAALLHARWSRKVLVGTKGVVNAGVLR